jgi:hypothetical protein
MYTPGTFLVPAPRMQPTPPGCKKTIYDFPNFMTPLKEPPFHTHHQSGKRS